MKYLFFGYGANRDKKRLEDIFKVSGLTGDNLIINGGHKALINGMVLGIQDLDQIPVQIQKVLRDVWGTKFKAYTLKPGKGQVSGFIWELNERQFQALKDWEFDGNWREVVEIIVITKEGRKANVYTEKAFDDAPISQIVDGLIYQGNLNEKMTIAQKFDDDTYRIKQLAKIRGELSNM